MRLWQIYFAVGLSFALTGPFLRRRLQWPWQTVFKAMFALVFCWPIVMALYVRKAAADGNLLFVDAEPQTHFNRLYTNYVKPCPVCNYRARQSGEMG